jgi:hypothetical protein
MSTSEVKSTNHVEVDDGVVLLVSGITGTALVVTPRLLRDLAEATATACGWPVQEAEGVRIGGSRRPIVTFMLGDVEHAADPQSARALAVALLRAADEAEATK